MRFQILFHSPPGVLFTFPSRYWFTIGRLRVFSFRGWSPYLQTGFHEARATRDQHSREHVLPGTGPTPSTVKPSSLFPSHTFLSFQSNSSAFEQHYPTTPHTQPPNSITRTRFNLLRFRSPLLTEYLFLQVLRCFTSLRTPHQTVVPPHNRW